MIGVKKIRIVNKQPGCIGQSPRNLKAQNKLPPLFLFQGFFSVLFSPSQQKKKIATAPGGRLTA